MFLQPYHVASTSSFFLSCFGEETNLIAVMRAESSSFSYRKKSIHHLPRPSSSILICASISYNCSGPNSGRGLRRASISCGGRPPKDTSTCRGGFCLASAASRSNLLRPLLSRKYNSAKLSNSIVPRGTLTPIAIFQVWLGSVLTTALDVGSVDGLVALAIGICDVPEMLGEE